MSLPVKALTSVAGIIARTNSTEALVLIAAGGRPGGERRDVDVQSAARA